VEVAAGEALEPGALEVSILTLDGQDERRERTVSVFSTASGVELWRWSQRSGTSREILSVGTYRLSVTIDPTHSFRDGTPGFESLLVDERTIEILAGRTTRIELWR
jgi:hypothetical protein